MGAPIWLAHPSPIHMDALCDCGHGYTRVHGRFFFSRFCSIWAEILVKKNGKILDQNTLFCHLWANFKGKNLK